MVTGSQQGQSGQTQTGQYGIFGVNPNGQLYWLQNAASQQQAQQSIESGQVGGGQNSKFEQLIVLQMPLIKQLQHA